MSENTTNKDVRNDEIDLLDLFGRIGRAFSRWGHALINFLLATIVFIIKRWLPLGISLIIGITISYLSKNVTYQVFSSDLILRNNAVSNSDMIEYLNRLHDYCLKSDFQSLSAALKIDSSLSKEIQDIKPAWIIGSKRERIPGYIDISNKFNESDTSNARMRDRMAIRVVSKSTLDLNVLKNGIITFINSDSLLNQKNRIRLKQNREMLTRLNTDIMQLDSLQKLKYFEDTQPKSGGQMIFLQEQKTQLIYSDIYTLYGRKQTIESEIGLYGEIVTVLNDFSTPSISSHNGLFYGKNIVIILFLLTLLSLVLISNRKKILEIYNKY